MEKSIIVDRLSKNFIVNQKNSGIKGAIESFWNPKQKVVQALKEVTFTVQKGELVGFIGPNGAGKTTTMKVLSGLIHPSSGFVSVSGFDPWNKSPEFLNKISLLMGQKNQLWWDLPAVDSFEFIKAVYQIPETEYKKNLEELVEILSVGSLLNTQVRKLSLGQRMKMELIASLLYSPEVMFMDEPTLGLDLIAQQNLRDFVYQYNRNKKATIMLTSHNMSDLVDLARRIIVINEGQIIYDGPFEGLTKKFAADKILKITLSNEVKLEDLEKIGQVKKNSFPEVSFSIPRDTITFAASEALQNFDVIDLSIEEPPIEEVVRKVFKGDYK